jgi:hypothetical protein
MANIFYISSWGGTATHWLAKSLDSHPELICYHGRRTWPQYPACHAQSEEELPQSQVRDPMDFANDMKAQAEQGQVVGSIHGYHGLAMATPVRALGGRFAASTRHPVLRTASLHRHHYAKLLDDNNPGQIASLNFFKNYAQSQAGIIQNIVTQTGIDFGLSELIYLWVSTGTVGFDLECNKLNPKYIFKMEEYTKDKDYYKEMFCFLTQNKVSCDDAYLDAVFTRGKTNVHRTKDSSAENEFSSWPESHRALFTTLFTDHRETYASMGYDIEFAFC